MKTVKSLLVNAAAGLVIICMMGGLIWFSLEQAEKKFKAEDEAEAKSDTLAQSYFMAADSGYCEPFTAVASWYGETFHGRVTANGETYNQHALTFAHRTMPFGTRIKFTRESKSIIGRCNDRGPFINGRAFDLSMAMADSLGMLDKGVDAVQFEIIK